MALRDLFIKLGVNVDQSKVDKFDKSLINVKSSMTGILGILGAGGLAGSLFHMTRSVAEIGDEASKTSQKIGVSVEAFQKLKYAASLADVDVSTLTMSLKLLSSKVQDAMAGNKQAAETFNSLGISIKDSSGNTKQADDLLSDLSDVFAKMPDGVKKTALAVDLFGRSGLEMIPLLNSGGDALKSAYLEAEKFGIVIGTKDAKAMEEFNDNITRLEASFTGLKIRLTKELFPVFEKFITWLKTTGLNSIENIINSLGGLNTILKVVFGTIAGYGMIKAGAAITYLISNITTLISSVKAFGTAALIAQGKALALPLIIGAGMAALLLIAEDVYKFFASGGKADTFTKDLVECFKVNFPDAVKAAETALNGFKRTVSAVLAMFETLRGNFKNASIAWRYATTGSFEESANDELKRLTEDYNRRQAVQSMNSVQGNDFAGNRGLTRINKTMSNNITAPITINATGGQSANDIAREVKNQLESTFQSIDLNYYGSTVE